ncbi:C40 family peptidase [Bacillus sp. FJAT-49736]|uniref:C40 family peptidase n=1 Tax=Bacillus sp. FJAT-49736 TaxID=2833582 RepID=UPI001BC91995|nr:C40 family peptidase [Bacillus sp. FJAT-49736]MBS4173911.1 LysM peptidoglycan-binding domain-containing protein [Bacillus sp. FJAT-49736]
MKRKLFSAIGTTGLLLSIYSGAAHASEKQYIVQSGDTLWKIAQNNQITVQDLTAWNNLSSNIIHFGQKLLVSPPQVQKKDVSYTVNPGDCLSSIAKKYNITVSDLKSANHLTSDIIKVGQVLNIQAASQVNSNSGNSIQTNDKIKPVSYNVKSGDSLSLIAKNNNMSVSDLKTINGLTSDTIYVGQVLKLSTEKVEATAVTTNVKTYNVDALITEAKKYIGVPYLWGGSAPSGFDCSGFINYVFNKQGISIPRTVKSIWDDTKTVSSPEKGDIVFFETASGPSHAGIYIGNNQFIHASSSSGVMISDLKNVYWKPIYLGVKRVY